MAKAGFWLKGARGKLGGSSLSQNPGGETIIRTINYTPRNPKTNAQVQVRSKLKLLSQLGAALADVLVIPRDGNKSARNMFTKINSDKVATVEGVAQISLDNVQISNSNRALPMIELSRATDDGVTELSVGMSESVAGICDRVVYIVYRKSSESQLQFIASKVVPTTNDNKAQHDFSTERDGDVTGSLVVYAYGIKDKDAAATVKYGQMQASAASDVAQLFTAKKLSASDYEFTQTRGASLLANESEANQVPDGSIRVFVTALGNGSVSGAGIKTIGASVTVTATPDEGASFVGWKNNGSDTIISTSASYTFTAPAQTVDLLAVFDGGTSPMEP